MRSVSYGENFFFKLKKKKKLMKYIDMDQNFTEVQKRPFRNSRNRI